MLLWILFDSSAFRIARIAFSSVHLSLEAKKAALSSRIFYELQCFSFCMRAICPSLFLG
jgi:hypothetical protein